MEQNIQFFFQETRTRKVEYTTLYMCAEGTEFPEDIAERKCIVFTRNGKGMIELPVSNVMSVVIFVCANRLEDLPDAVKPV